MIDALDESIKQLLIQKTPLDQSEVDVSFDVPNREWSKAISKPTVNVYLHDIRENLELPSYGWSMERNGDGSFTKAKLGHRFDLSYLITAWTRSIEDEHRLIWYVLSTMAKYSYVPFDILQGPLRDVTKPMHTKVARPDGILRNVADVWTALENQLKPVIPYVVTLDLEPSDFTIVSEVRTKFIKYMPLVVEEEPKKNQSASGSLWGFKDNLPVGSATRKRVRIGSEVLSHHTQIGGHITDSTDPTKPIKADVILVEQGLNMRTDEQGRFTFTNLVPRSQYTVIAVAPGYETTRQELVVPAKSYDFQMQPEAEEAEVRELGVS